MKILIPSLVSFYFYTWRNSQGLIRLLSTCASGSPLGAKTLLLHGISRTLKEILSGYGLSSSISVSPALTRPPEQVRIVSLLRFIDCLALSKCADCKCHLVLDF